MSKSPHKVCGRVGGRTRDSCIDRPPLLPTELSGPAFKFNLLLQCREYYILERGMINCYSVGCVGRPVLQGVLRPDVRLPWRPVVQQLLLRHLTARGARVLRLFFACRSR